MMRTTEYKQLLAKRDSAAAGVCSFGRLPSIGHTANPEWRPAS